MFEELDTLFQSPTIKPSFEKSEKELADIKGIGQNKAIELATVSKLYLGENEISLLKK